MSDDRIGGAIPAPPTHGSDIRGEIDIGRLLRAVRRQIFVIVSSAVLGITVAVLIILGTVPQYTAVETVLLDAERAELLNEVSPLPSAIRSDSAVQSEIEIIKSQAVALGVVDRLDLDEDAMFLSPPTDLVPGILASVSAVLDPIRQVLTPAAPATTMPNSTETGQGATAEAVLQEVQALSPREIAARLLRSRIEVRRVGLSFVIEIAVRDVDPIRATQIARAYGAVYERFQLEATGEVAGNAADWLEERIDVLEQLSLEAASNLQQFRQDNDLYSVRGELLNEQQISELASQLVSAAAATAERQAQYLSLESLREQAEDGATVVAVPDAVEGESLASQDLRREYIDTQLRYRRLVAQFGEDHPQALQLKQALTDLEETNRLELDQATEAARIAYNVALSRENSLRGDLDAATSSGNLDYSLRGHLQQLEARAQTFDAIHRQYLQRYEVASQQQGFPIAAVKVITEAEVPAAPSSPQKRAMLLAGAFLGGFIGMMIAAMREMRSKPLRTPSAVREIVGVGCAGLIPRGKSSRTDRSTRTRTLDRVARICESAVRGGPKLIGIAPLDDTIRGQSDFVDELAERLAKDSRQKVLVVIPDTGARRRHTKTGIPGSPHRISLNAVRANPERADGIEFQGDETMVEDDLKDNYRYILTVLPPLTSAGNLKVQPLACDATVLLIPWGKVLPDYLSDALKDRESFADTLLTTVLDGADVTNARRYMSHRSFEERETYA
ncbi:GumC family protein [Wenxinia marina]|uniref:GumC family protein n=1 Tax=Wenxinia marina TaxID=390641 RepID=UPI0003A2B6B9|nr:GumC family protein [Wenxinia marina]GGL71878.1 hypothetical protein GCM10011392_28100 [Wenxinia marina]